MSKHKRIFHKQYDGESIVDADRDVWEAIEFAEVPTDEYGFQKGTFYVTVMWKPDDE